MPCDLYFVIIILYRQWGGGTLGSLAAELKKYDICQHIYHDGSCILHNIQTCLRNSIISILREGGRDKDGKYKSNVMQLVRGFYNVFNYIECDVIKTIWNDACQVTGKTKRFVQMSAPILTRW